MEHEHTATTSCQVCYGLDPQIMFKNHALLLKRDDILNSFENHCPSCVVLWLAVQAFYDWNATTAIVLSFSETLTIHAIQVDHGLNSGTDLRQIEHVALYTHADMCSRWPAAIRVAPSRAGMSRPLENARRWIETCHREHTKCKRSTEFYAPTRLIEVGSDTVDPFLYISSGRSLSDDYVALSHRWGPQTSNVRRLELRSDNIEQFQNRIPLSILPKTFCDAITTARSLGYRYIWIDSLCIIQQDQEDWEREAAQMCAVYSNAAVTIAADSASHSDDGFLKTENNLGNIARKIEIMEPAGGKDILFARKSKFTLTLRELPCYTDEEYSNVDRRAWTLQEQILSPRILHFGEHELRWECDECTFCQCEISMSSSAVKRQFLSLVRDDPSLKVQERTKLSWGDLVRNFTSRDITFASDRLPAIGGVAEAIQRLSADEYMAGLWKSSVARDLLWEASLTGSTFYGERPQNHARRHDSYYCPSWSWASITGTVGFIGEKAELLWTIVEASCSSAGSNPYGKVADGYVKIRGPLSKVSIERDEFFNSRTNHNQIRHFVVSREHPRIKKLAEKAAPDIGPDGIELDHAQDFWLLFAAVEGSPAGWGIGLLLTSAKSCSEVYRRVGIVSCERQQWDRWESVTKLATVTII